MMANSASSSPGGRLRFTSEGLAWFATTLVLGALGWLKSLNLLLLLAYMMAALLVINGVLARWQARRVRTNRVPLPPVFAGETVRAGVVAKNDGSRPAMISILDGFAQWNVASLAAGDAAELMDLRSYPSRGRFTTPAIQVASAFPFGFLKYEYARGTDDEILVLPALGKVDADGLRRWVLKRAGTEGRSRKVLRRVTTDLADIRGVRPYRSGDSIRAIHWRTSARRRELMVREYDAAPSPDLLVVVEPWLPEEPTDLDRAKLEAALSLAATMIHSWAKSIETRTMLVLAGASPTKGSASPGDSGVREVLIPLAGAMGTTESAEIAPSSFGRSTAKSARVVVSSRSGSPLAARLGHLLGKPFLAMDASQRLPWYQPPGVS
jgi:uncharacterized protein (DUF58 family)